MEQVQQVRFQLHLIVRVKCLNVEHQFPLFPLTPLYHQLLRIAATRSFKLLQTCLRLRWLLRFLQFLSDRLFVFAELSHVLEKVVLLQLEMRHNEMLNVSLSAFGRCHIFLEQIIAGVLYFSQLGVQHCLLLQFLLNLLTDDLVI